MFILSVKFTQKNTRQTSKEKRLPVKGTFSKDGKDMMKIQTEYIL